LAEISHARAAIALNHWAKTHDPTTIAEMGRHLDRIPSSYPNWYGVNLLRSIFLFVHHRDVKGAVAILKKCKGVPEGTWLYNLAFLHAYMGDLKKAVQRYRNAIGLPVEPAVAAAIEEFICWVLEEEPQKYQLHYCLGFINWKIKGDTGQAKEDFETFLVRGNDKEFTFERELARKWISEIQHAADDSNPARD
jgi:hypothetical protein